MCKMMLSYVWHCSLICATWAFVSATWAFVSATWRICKCDMTHL